MTRLPLNSRILEYRITDNLGSGGFAHTYQAIDTNLDKRVAIKEFFPARLCTRGAEYRVKPLPGAEDRFARYLSSFIEEARILAKFDQPNIVKVLRYFEALGTAYIIMEFVDGRSINDYFAFDNVLGEERVSKWMTGILDGLQAIHAADIIHGDIKPKNILITDAGEAVLIDFGASVIYKAAQENAAPVEELHLSSAYAAPEQFIRGATLDHRIDLYALGAVFYQAITGEKLKDAVDAGNDIGQELQRYRRFYNQKLLTSVAQALQADPQARFHDAGAWLDFVTLSPGEKFARALRRNRRAIAAVLLLVSLVGYGAYYVVQNDIDMENLHYKVFASRAEVLEKLRSADAIIAKLQEARGFLVGYGNEYGAQVAKIEPADLVTGRNSIASLADYLGPVEATRREIERAIAELQRLRDKYYFDDLSPPLDRVNREIKAFDAQQRDFNTLLLAAFAEAEAVRRARERSIEIDQAALAELVTALRAGEELKDLGALVPTALPVVEDFLEAQRLANERRQLEERRRQVLRSIADLSEPLRKNRRYREFAPTAEAARQAERLSQVERALSSAEALAADIRNEQRQAAARRAAQKRESERRAVVNAIDAGMVEVPADKFTMGSNRHGYARPPRTVTVHGFYIHRHEVTVAQWNECVRDGVCKNPPLTNEPDYPVTGVSWDAAQAFITWVNDASTRFRYRLLSEAEWEFVAKKYGYVVKELEPKLTSVTVQETNKLGINSIMGNALEWLDDCWHGGYVGAPPDSRSWNRGLECSRRVVRGTNWEGDYDLTQNNATFFRPAGLARDTTRPTLGFRLAGERR